MKREAGFAAHPTGRWRRTLYFNSSSSNSSRLEALFVHLSCSLGTVFVCLAHAMHSASSHRDSKRGPGRGRGGRRLRPKSNGCTAMALLPAARSQPCIALISGDGSRAAHMGVCRVLRFWNCI